jgi:pre-mRNA-processing factor 8
MQQLSPYDVSMQAKTLADNSTWDVDSSIVITCSFTQGSCTLTSYKLSPLGLDWGRNNKDFSPSPPGYSSACYEKVQLLLSEKFMGFFMVPDNEVWNYNFIGIALASSIKYSLVLANPKEFYHEIHRPSHFLSFAKNEGEQIADSDAVEREDNFT